MPKHIYIAWDNRLGDHVKASFDLELIKRAIDECGDYEWVGEWKPCDGDSWSREFDDDFTTADVIIEPLEVVEESEDD